MATRSMILGLVLVALLPACRSVYYDVMEGFGREKRHILASRVEDGREEQQEAQAQFQDALERFQALTGFEGGELEDRYHELSAAFEASEAKAVAVGERIASIETVAEDLFEEWEGELAEISRADLRRRSGDQLKQTQRRYARLIAAMRKAEGRMEPVLTAFRDHVLFLKHNLNASAIASLEGDAAQIESDVRVLVAEMNAAIREADAFLEGLSQ